jgi:hypothetical protein
LGAPSLPSEAEQLPQTLASGDEPFLPFCAYTLNKSNNNEYQ